MRYSFQSELKIPAPVSALCFASNDALSVGSDDGSVRVYSLPTIAVTKAIRGLGDEISSICWTTPFSSDNGGKVWVASGQKASLFEIGKSKLIFTSQDALLHLELGEDQDDVLNELSVSDNKKIMAFSTDGGTVGVVDLVDYKVIRTKTRHSSICASVKFVPDRSSELVSGGYDSALLHFDFKQGSLLSRHDIAAAQPSSGVSLSPPFVLSISISPVGLIAATTADGRLWIGTGGDKTISLGGKNKKSRKWEGLRESEGQFVQIADGPVVASTFVSESSLLTCTLLGKIAQHNITYNEERKVHLETSWTCETRGLEKVNAIAASKDWLAIGGFGKDEKGLVEVWSVSNDSELTEITAKLSLHGNRA